MSTRIIQTAKRNRNQDDLAKHEKQMGTRNSQEAEFRKGYKEIGKQEYDTSIMVLKMFSKITQFQLTEQQYIDSIRQLSKQGKPVAESPPGNYEKF